MYWPKYRKTLFPGQQDGEEVHMEMRQHWLVFFAKFLIWCLFAAILIGSDWAIDHYAPVLKTSTYIQFLDLARSVYFMTLILGLLIVWVMYYLNVQIITNQRIVDITQDSLIHHTISELHLSHIEDVTAEVDGLFGTFLDYGNVYVQTAGAAERFIFDRVPNPTAVTKIILDLYEALPEDQKHKNPLGR